MTVEQIGNYLSGFGPIRRALERRYLRRFRTERGAGCWAGVFGSFAEAAAAAPRQLPLGYDQPAAATLYDDRPTRASAKDYPVLFWLQRILGPSSSVFDFGGHVGVSYYVYRQYLERDSPLDWTVCDVPAVVEAGEIRARARGESELRFTTRFEDCSGAHVLLASGSLQYVEPSLSTLLSGLPVRPRHVLINKLPTHSDREFVTLQSLGVAYCPYRISARDALPASLASLGYEEVDSWENPEARTRLPFHPEASPITWRGHYFRMP